jgi:hypothetical protein
MKLILTEQKTHNYGYLKRIFLVPQHILFKDCTEASAATLKMKELFPYT